MKRRKSDIKRRHTGDAGAGIFFRAAGILLHWRDCFRICMDKVCICIFRIQGTEARARFLAEQVEQTTGLKDFGSYLSRVLTIDALFLNEDRHMHNIAVLNDGFGNYHYCPVFDNGCALLSDTQMEYPTVVPGLLTAIDRRKMKNSEKIV